jgi:acyl-CoA synthetase (AMP-forming)/AMP-acid ligase II
MKTIADLIDRNAVNFPRAEAFVCDERRQTYREYAERARCLAHALYVWGVRHQDRVGVLATNNIEYYEIYGACELSGFIAALYNFRSAKREVEYLLQDSQPKVVFFEHQFLEMIDSLRARFVGVERWVCLGGAASEWAEDYESTVASGNAAGEMSVRAEATDIAYLYYTSGTTGTPKGVPITHQAALQAAQLEGRRMGSGARFLQISPAYHLGGKGYPLGALWMAGAVIIYRGSFDPGQFARLIAAEHITDTFMVPTMMLAVLDYLVDHEADVSSLRSVVAASTAIPVTLLRRAIDIFGPIFYVSYGSTETSNIASLMMHELKPDGCPDDIRRLGSVGHFEPEVEGAIIAADGRLCETGEVGEVCVRRPSFKGYWNNSVATIEATAGGWLHTGDMGFLDDEGFLFLVDRKKDMIISGGENIYSREVEEVLYRHDAVAEVAVIGVPNEKWGEVVKAFVVLRAEERVTDAELIEHCQEYIARYKCPRSIVFVEQLPMLANGKLDKVTLRKNYTN